MNKTTSNPLRKRAYNQTARAEAAEATSARIVEVFHALLQSEWYDDISLEQIAKGAAVTVPTILRRFGSKEGLLDPIREKMEREIDARRTAEPGNIPAITDAIVEDYEAVGEVILRMLAQEDRLPALKALADYGRAQHRAWVSEVFAPQLADLKKAERDWTLDGLMAALDIYVWKVLRQDRGHSPPEVSRFMRQLVNGILAGK